MFMVKTKKIAKLMDVDFFRHPASPHKCPGIESCTVAKGRESPGKERTVFSS